MSKNCSCSTNTKPVSVINDSCPDVNSSICTLAQQVFDCVKVTLDATACTVTVTNPVVKPVTLLTAHSTSQQAMLFDVKTQPYDEQFRTVSADVVFTGICSYTGCDCNTYCGECSITVPYEALMRYPDASVIKPDLTAIGYCEIIRSSCLCENCFSCLCDGAMVVCLCSFVPVYVPLVARLCPVNATCRTAQPQEDSQSLFPQTD